MSPSLRLRSDEHLVRLFRAGREDAFEAIHDRHARRLHAVAAAALRSRGGDSEGIVQEAFARAHRSLRDGDRPIELSPWLHRIVRNLCTWPPAWPSRARRTGASRAISACTSTRRPT
jgi:hypothetical protein